jgi:hypothetical protein
MRLLTFLAAAVLLLSLFLAARHYSRREAAFPMARFVTADAASRAGGGYEAGELGIALGGYEDLVRARPDDLDALRGHFRTTLVIGSVGLGQPRLPDLHRVQAETYLAKRDRMDPDGSFLKEVIRQWVDGRVRVDWYHQAGFYACAATAIFAGARGDPKGPETLLAITRQGNFYLEFFPFARRYHPGWPIVEPLVVHYLEHGDLAGRVEAGVTLLDYHALFGVGGELVDRHLPAIRDSIREMRRRVRAFTDEGASDVGRAAIVGMALLANRGEEEEARLLAEVKAERDIVHYAPHADTVRLARMWAGIDDYSTMGPLTARYKELHEMDQEIYYLGAAHRAALLMRQGAAETEPRVAGLLDLLEAAFDGPVPSLRVFSMQAMLRLAPARGAALVKRAIDGRGPFAVYAGTLADNVEDPASLYLPYLASPMPDIAALAAASLLDLPHPHALQR